MNFHLNYTPPPLPEKIDHKDKILMMGSCFAENIGHYLTKYKFNCKINPNGILFNPNSITTSLQNYISNETEKTYIVKNSDLVYSLHHHGDFSFKTENELSEHISNSQKQAHDYLKQSNW